MFEVFEQYILSQITLTPDELQFMRSLSISKKIRRRQFLLREGEVARHKVFVGEGLLRTYRRGDDGTEYILRFATENQWTTDHESYSNQIPSRLNIDALEDTTAILWTKESFQQLCEAIPTLGCYVVRVMSHSMDAAIDRVLGNISYTNEEKYQDFVDSFPDVIRRVPLHMVASYLGVSRETLSRIRRLFDLRK
jgi:CRP-like cAMP-binding protein